jgi:hypothetical protein
MNSNADGIPATSGGVLLHARPKLHENGATPPKPHARNSKIILVFHESSPISQITNNKFEYQNFKSRFLTQYCTILKSKHIYIITIACSFI